MCSGHLIANTHGFQSLRCTEILKPSYFLVVNNNSLELRTQQVVREPESKILTKVHYAFSLKDCKFKPFSVDLVCSGSDLHSEKKHGAISVRLSVEKNRYPYRVVTMRTKSIPGFPSQKFEMTRIDYGYKSQCKVNGIFDIR